MKVTFIIQDLFSQGAQRATALMCRGFIEKGYKVDLIVSAFHNELVSHKSKGYFSVPEKVQWIHLKDRRARKNIGELRSYLKSTDSFVVISMCSTYTEALALAAIGIRKRPLLFSVEHGITFALREDWSEKKKPSIFSLEWFKWKLLKRQFDGFLAVSSRIAKEYMRMYAINAKVVYNPVDAIHKIFNLNISKKDRIVTAGSFTSDKNHIYLIKSFEQAIQRNNHALWTTKLVIFGEGPLRNEYEQYISEHNLEDYIELPGFSSNIYSEINNSIGYICSSNIESFAIAPVEAMACRVPVVCCDCPCGPREILKGGKYGRLVPTGNIEAMSLAITDLVHGKIETAPHEAYEKFSVKHITELYEKALDLTIDNTTTKNKKNQKQSANCIEHINWLYPINRGGYQFFREWATEAWEKSGGKIKEDIKLPWNLKMLFGKLGLCRSILKPTKRLVICVGGRIDYYAWPWCYFYEIVPIIWDCWPKYWAQLVKDVERMKIKTVFCTSRQTTEYLRSQIDSQVSVIWLPEGIKSDLYPMGPRLVERKTDIMQFGRDANGEIRYPMHESFTAALRDAKIVTCYPRCDTHPEQAGNLETLTQRYWECMLSGCLIVGRAPQELIDLIGYNPVVPCRQDDKFEEFVNELLSKINEYQELVNKNRETAVKMADWSQRIPIIRATLDK